MTVPAHSATDEASLSERINETAQRLAAEFEGRFTKEVIEQAARSYLASYEGAVVQDFVPLFVERYTRETLRASIASHA